MRPNPFAEIYRKMYSTPDSVKFENLPDYPLLIDIELTNHCNMRCLFCGNRAQTRQKGFMDTEVYTRILEQVGGGVPLRFVRWGENMLHNRMLDFFRMAKRNGNLIHLTTNGSLLNAKVINTLVETPLDSIKFSFQGVNESGYELMRNSSMFSKVMDNLKLFYEIRGDRERPYIHVSSTMTDESSVDIEAFRANVSRYCDSVDTGKTSLSRYNIFDMNFNEEEFERYVHLRKKESVNKNHMECPEVFDKLSINWDGTVSACCGDYDNMFIVGDIRRQTIEEIWKGDRMNEIRCILLRGEHDKLSLCSVCYSPYDFVRKKEKELD